MRVATMTAVMAVMAPLLSGCWRDDVDEIIDNVSTHQMLERMSEACEAHCEHIDACGSDLYWGEVCTDVCVETWIDIRGTERWECAELFTADFECLSRASCDELTEDEELCLPLLYDAVECLYPED